MSDDDFSDLEIIDDSALLALDAIESAYVNGTALPPRTVVSKPGLVQRDLFGAAIAPAPPKPQPVAGLSRTNSANAAGVGGETRAKVRLSKTWDPATFARHGWSKKNAAVAKAKAKGKSGKGKQKAYASDEEPWDDDDEEVLDDDSDDGDDEFLVDTSYDPNAPILPIKWAPDENAAQTFVYPVQADKPLRSYQLNIIQRALFDNTLVSLPTGLGKTFIAAVVMLNFYRWYPKGKVLFLAPTRPLVTQQIKACHYIAGIPQADCIELTGGTAPRLRSVGWLTKRVIYSTPQTVERDLAKGRLDPRDVTCVVIDEAHRASGDYSYCGVIRYMMSRNPHFRVLALTATPGARGEAVQEVIDNLHIGRIEVRAEDSIDIRQYIHKKSFDLRVLPLGKNLRDLRDKWIALMRPFHGPLLAAKLIYQKDPALLSPYGVQQAYQKINQLPGGRQANGKYFSMIKTLAAMARAIEYLTVQSVTSFESVVKDLQQNGSKALVQQPGFRDILRETSALRAHPGYVGHPKMEMLRSICLEHFKSSLNLVDEYGDKRETRVMIFCNFRAVVEEIVACLNTQKPLIKATAFVGQASSKGVKGKSQKEQLETIRRFKKGHYNVLVATSIGEEGLDIGEIDLIICYESNKSPIRMLQRVGRTGRARDGHITVLMTEGREEKSWDQANDAYNDVQNALTSNKIFDLYVDGERLLPDHIKPKCEQVEIKAQPLDIEKMTMN
ncbi:P-loop containing nucleoside triphosphate hydrolase protein, partial [Rhodotorula sp. JG-1b]